jgi:hypothetical protein
MSIMTASLLDFRTFEIPYDLAHSPLKLWFNTRPEANCGVMKQTEKNSDLARMDRVGSGRTARRTPGTAGPAAFVMPKFDLR